MSVEPAQLMSVEPAQLMIDASHTRAAGFLLDKHGTPELSKLTICGAPPLDEPPNYLGAFVLNSIFIAEYPDPLSRMILMFGRRVEHAAREYITGREFLSAYVGKLAQTNTHFLRAMRATTHFEQCIASTCQASMFLGRMNGLIACETPATSLDDREDRLRKMWNRLKHFDEDLAVPNKLDSAEITAPVWLTNQGISCTKASVTFHELHSVLVDLLGCLKSLCVDIPNQIAERRIKSEGAG